MYATGAEYSGKWVNDKPEGKGAFIVFEKESEKVLYKYDGEWKNGKPHGQGTLQVGKHYEYEGQWVEGKREGRGTSKDICGSYSGLWKNDKVNESKRS